MAVQTRSRNHTHGWGVPMSIGILLIIGGMFSLAATVLTSLVSVIYFGTLLLAIGVLEIVAAFRLRSTGPVLSYALAGLLTIVVGGLCVFRPVASVASVTLLIAGYLFASGLFRGVTSLMDRYPGWGWDFVYSLLTVGLGFYVAAAWPLDSFWVLGTIVGIEIVARGITLVAAAWMLRDIEHGQPATA